MSEDRWAGIDAFVAVAELGSFTAAAVRLGVSVSHVSREVTRLEARLGRRLFARSTRQVTKTDDGLVFEARCRSLIDARDAAFDAVLGDAEAIEGAIRLTCPVAYGETQVAPLVNQFLHMHPGLHIDMVLTNAVVDMIAQGFDLAIRVGDVDDARLHAERLGTRGLHVCASPAYLARVGTPATIVALQQHDCLVGSVTRWHFTVDGRDVQYRPRGRWRCNSGFAVVEAALDGLGLCQLPDFYLRDHLASGALVEVLAAERTHDQPIWALYPERDHVPRRLLALVDHIRQGTALSQ